MTKEIQFLGIPFSVMDEEDLLAATNGTGEHIHMVARVKDCEEAEAAGSKPWPELVKRRFKVRCSICKELCWFDPKSSLLPGYGQIVCLRCVIDHIESKKNRTE